MAFDITPFRQLSLAFDPIFRDSRPAAGAGRYYVPQIHAEFRRQFVAPLLLADDVKLLLAGQPGCGKTTLLHDIARDFRDKGRLVAFIDMELVTAVQELGHAEMNLAALSALLRDEQARLLAPETIAACHAWLAHVTPMSTTQSEPAVLGQRIASFLSAARDNSQLRHELRTLVREGGDRDPVSLLTRALQDLAPARPLLILDGLDKLPPDQARTFFLEEKRKPMADVPGAAVLTIPLSVVYEPTFNVLSERYQNADNAVLPAVRLYALKETTRQRERLEEGWAILRRMVAARSEPAGQLIEYDAIELAIESSGGNLRELARLLKASIVKAVVRESERVARHHVEEAIADQRESFGRVYQDRFLPVLRRVREEHRLDNVDDIGKLLLYGLWVVEYRNGFVWYDLPLPVRRLLEQRERGA